jgi:hypothetical protein
VDKPRREPDWRELDDATLLAHLRQALREHESPPPWVVELSKACFALRRLDAELATLVADSLDEATGPRVRAVHAPRMVSFASGDLTVEVGLAPGSEGWRLVGQLDPPDPARIELRRPTGSPGTVVDTDRRGRFTLDVTEPGPVSLLCHRQGRPAVVTTWLQLS